MKSEMGAVIRRLRKERNLTQEELAELLNVSNKTVSKWESGSGLPDISQLVPLAAVFGVGTDVLFGTYGMDNDREADKIYAAGFSETDYKKRWDIFQEGLKRLPNNSRILQGAIHTGRWLVWEYRRQGDGRADEIFAETVRLAKLQISYGRNLRDVNDAKYCLAEVYSMYGMHDKALDIADTLPPEYTSVSGVLKANIKRGAGDIASEIEQREDNIVGFLLAINNEIYGLGEAYAKLGRYDEAVRTYASFLKALEIFSSLKDKLKARTLFEIKIAQCYESVGDIDKAKEWREKSCMDK